MLRVDGIAVAPRDEALSFARFEQDGTLHLLLVTSCGPELVTGIDLTETTSERFDDPVTAFQALSYEGLLLRALGGSEVHVPRANLVMPVTLAASHIAVGTNFPEHAQESEVTDGPFLFPKEVVPTAFNAPVSAGDALLDYEVELCFVTLTDIDPDLPPAYIGLTLCNDVTDRAKLLRHADPRNVTSGKGFTTGKSAPGYFPIGSLFVIPRDFRQFVAKLELHLWRNGELKQRAMQSEAIWNFDALLRETKAREGIAWAYQEGSVSLPLESGKIPARTGLLAGTPDGTIFHGVAKSAMLRGLIDWLTGGWSRPVTHWIVERQIAREQRLRRYLRVGEVVTIRVERMGELRTPVIA
ncbi:MAG: fumarylacetoacetate hydrolase family protein [Parvibaculaceae bacterium]